jgi:hypothetical protein
MNYIKAFEILEKELTPVIDNPNIENLSFLLGRFEAKLCQAIDALAK